MLIPASVKNACLDKWQGAIDLALYANDLAEDEASFSLYSELIEEWQTEIGSEPCALCNYMIDLKRNRTLPGGILSCNYVCQFCPLGTLEVAGGQCWQCCNECIDANESLPDDFARHARAMWERVNALEVEEGAE